MNRDLGYLKQHLTEKYIKKKWHDSNAATSASVKISSPSLTRSSSGKSSDNSDLIAPSISIAAPSQGRARTRTRSGSGTNLASGSSDHKAFLAETYARASGNNDLKSVTSGLSGMNVSRKKDESDDSDSDSSDDDGKALSLDEKQEKERKKLKNKMLEFYKKYNTEKIAEIDIFVEWTLYHGLEAFNSKLIERYGAGIKIKKKSSKLKDRSRSYSTDKPGTISPSIGLSKTGISSPKINVKSPLSEQKKTPDQKIDFFSAPATTTTAAAPGGFNMPAASTTTSASNMDIFSLAPSTQPFSTTQTSNQFVQQQPNTFQNPFGGTSSFQPQPSSSLFQQQQQFSAPMVQQSYFPPQNNPFGGASQGIQMPMQQMQSQQVPMQQVQQPPKTKNPFEDMQMFF